VLDGQPLLFYLSSVSVQPLSEVDDEEDDHDYCAREAEEQPRAQSALRIRPARRAGRARDRQRE
jgi:hypothetical protein